VTTKKKETLDRIEKALIEMLDAGQIARHDCFMQLIYVAFDYLEDESVLEAIRILNLIDLQFLMSLSTYKDKVTDFAKSAYRVYDYFGLEWEILPQSPKGAWN
jgi:hypothetical protein